MGFSFHDELSLVEAVSDLRFEVADRNPIPGLESISLDGSLLTGPHDPNAISEMIVSKRGETMIWAGGDDIQIVDTG
jgi:hypothetical protein